MDTPATSFDQRFSDPGVAAPSRVLAFAKGVLSQSLYEFN